MRVVMNICLCATKGWWALSLCYVSHRVELVLFFVTELLGWETDKEYLRMGHLLQWIPEHVRGTVML